MKIAFMVEYTYDKFYKPTIFEVQSIEDSMLLFNTKKYPCLGVPEFIKRLDDIGAVDFPYELSADKVMQHIIFKSNNKTNNLFPNGLIIDINNSFDNNEQLKNKTLEIMESRLNFHNGTILKCESSRGRGNMFFHKNNITKEDSYSFLKHIYEHGGKGVLQDIVKNKHMESERYIHCRDVYIYDDESSEVFIFPLWKQVLSLDDIDFSKAKNKNIIYRAEKPEDYGNFLTSRLDEDEINMRNKMAKSLGHCISLYNNDRILFLNQINVQTHEEIDAIEYHKKKISIPENHLRTAEKSQTRFVNRIRYNLSQKVDEYIKEISFDYDLYSTHGLDVLEAIKEIKATKCNTKNLYDYNQILIHLNRNIKNFIDSHDCLFKTGSLLNQIIYLGVINQGIKEVIIHFLCSKGDDEKNRLLKLFDDYTENFSVGFLNLAINFAQDTGKEDNLIEAMCELEDECSFIGLIAVEDNYKNIFESIIKFASENNIKYK